MMAWGALTVMLAAGLAAGSDDLSGARDATVGFAPAILPLPEIVARNLRADVPLVDVRVRERCLYDQSGGEVIAVTTNVGGAMLPYCIG